MLSCSVNLAECSNLSLQPHPSKRLALKRTMNGTNTAFIFFLSGRLHAKGRLLSQRRFSAFLLLCLCDFVWYVEVNDPLDCSVSFSCVSFAFSQVTFPGDVGITTRNSTLLSLLPKKISEISKVYVACLACFTAECSSWWSPQLRSCICQKSAWVPEQPTRRQDHIKIPHFIKSI